jgi:hypothetical protein
LLPFPCYFLVAGINNFGHISNEVALGRALAVNRSTTPKIDVDGKEAGNVSLTKSIGDCATVIGPINV